MDASRLELLRRSFGVRKKCPGNISCPATGLACISDGAGGALSNQWNENMRCFARSQEKLISYLRVFLKYLSVSRKSITSHRAQGEKGSCTRPDSSKGRSYLFGSCVR